MSLIEEIKENQNLRSLFGKRELLIIEKQLLGIKLEPSEKTRLSRDIRKKLKTVESLSKFKEEFSLKHGAKIKEMINDTKEVILDTAYFSKIKKIYLFGSIAEGTNTLRSDIDMAVEFSEINLKEATKFRIYISERVSNKIDIQVYNVLPKKIKKEINSKGKIIYDKKNKNR